MPRTIPPDPEGQNDARAEWARIALDRFIEETNTDTADALADLLADLMHWCDRNGESFTVELDRARRHYAEETSIEDDEITDPDTATMRRKKGTE